MSTKTKKAVYWIRMEMKKGGDPHLEANKILKGVYLSASTKTVYMIPETDLLRLIGSGIRSAFEFPEEDDNQNNQGETDK